VTFRISQVWPIASACFAVATIAVVVAGINSPLRPALVLLFLVLAPGMALVRLLGIPDPIAVIMLAIAISLALGGVVAGTMVYTGTWSPVGGLLGLTLFTFAVNVTDVVVSIRSKAAP
jgi:uncharacterized membrane protein